MQDKTYESIAKIINHVKTQNVMGSGKADAQKVLVAAVETESISTDIANNLSDHHDLGLHWKKPSIV